VTLLMINIDECLMEKASCESSCTNFLTKSSTPSAVYTNTSSFVGVRAVVDPMCTCTVPEPLVCLNGGTPVGTMLVVYTFCYLKCCHFQLNFKYSFSVCVFVCYLKAHKTTIFACSFVRV
jgi:hypothetical protein